MDLASAQVGMFFQFVYFQRWKANGRVLISCLKVLHGVARRRISCAAPRSLAVHERRWLLLRLAPACSLVYFISAS